MRIRKNRNKEAYESVTLAANNDNSKIVSKNSTGPTVTLLRDFDPCFETTEEELEEEEVSEESDDCDAIYEKIREKPVDQEDAPELPIVKPRTKFPLGSPKKINFGPPKPPRQFNLSPKKCEEIDGTKTSPTFRGIKSMLSDSNLLRRVQKDSEIENVKECGENIYIKAPVLHSSEATIDVQGKYVFYFDFEVL